MTRILIPPGIGDSYWVLTKLPALIERDNLGTPELTIVSDKSDYNAHLRSIPFLELFDFIKIGDPVYVPNDRSLQYVWDEAYFGPGRSIFRDIMGYDYFIAYNGRINSGDYIENDNLPCDWHPLMNKNTDGLTKFFREKFRKYAVLFFPFYGTYACHIQDFPVNRIAEGLNAFFSKTRLTPVFVGADWDIGLNSLVKELISQIPNAVNYSGKTTLLEGFGLLKGAEIVAGYHAGFTNMAAVFGIKTLLLWDSRFPESTSWACVPPECRRTNYFALPTSGMTPERYTECLMRVVTGA